MMEQNQAVEHTENMEQSHNQENGCDVDGHLDVTSGTVPKENGIAVYNEDSAISRITNLPLVTSALTSVCDAYQWTKESSSLMNSCLGVAEKSVAVAASTAQPVVHALERPINAVNSVANQQLDKLEEKMPIITEPSDKVVKSLKESAWGAVEQSKAVGTQKMNDLMDTRVGQVVASTVNAALQFSDMAVDYCLPETEDKSGDAQQDDEGEEVEVSGEPPVPSNERFSHSVSKATQVSKKVRKRLYLKALVNLQYAQKQSQETLQKLHSTVDMIAYAKKNIDSANSGIRAKVDSTQQNLWNTWNDWTTEPREEGEEERDEDVEGKSGEQRTLAIARNLTRRLRTLTNHLSASIRVLPHNLGKSIEEARTSAEALFNTFEEARHFRDLPASLLANAKERLVQLSEASVALADHLVNSTAMQWLVPDINIDELELDFEMDIEEEDPIVCNHVGQLPTGI